MSAHLESSELGGTAPTSPASDGIAQPEMADLLAQMAQGSATDGWDVVVSYDVDALNAILASGHQAGSLVDTMKFKVTRTDVVLQTKYTAAYDITLGAPSLRFLAGESGVTRLTIPLTDGTCTITPDGGKPTVHKAPAGYSLTANVPLASMSGDGTIRTTGMVVTFADADDAAHIILHFKSGDQSGTTFGMALPSGDPGSDLWVTDFLPGVDDYFARHVNEIDYALAGVSAAPAAGETVITPKCFVFASDARTLSLYIETVNSGGQQGNTHPSFQIGGLEMLPIPQGHTSSVILSESFVKDVFLEPALSLLGTVSPDDTATSGIAVDLNRNLAPLSYDASFPGAESLEIDTLTVDFSAKEQAYHLTFLNGDASISWSFSQQLKWTTNSVDVATGDDFQESGSTTVYATLPVQTTTIPAPTETDIALTFDVQPDQYQFSADGRTSWFSSGPMISDRLTSYLQGQPTLGISIKFGTLNYFIVANLLLPGTHAFHVSADAGTNIPRDLLLVGSIS